MKQHRPFMARPGYDPNKPPRDLTPKQIVALRVFRIRGLYSFAGLLAPARAEAMRSLINDELRDLGVETQADRLTRQRQEFDAYFEQEPPSK